MPYYGRRKLLQCFQLIFALHLWLALYLWFAETIQSIRIKTLLYIIMTSFIMALIKMQYILYSTLTYFNAMEKLGMLATYTIAWRCMVPSYGPMHWQQEQNLAEKHSESWLCAPPGGIVDCSDTSGERSASGGSRRSALLPVGCQGTRFKAMPGLEEDVTSHKIIGIGHSFRYSG